MIMVFRFLVLGMVFIGAVASLPAIWNFADLSMGLMALTNLVAIVLLSPVALRILRDYERQIKEGKTGEQIKFNPDDFVKLKDEANREAWKD
ncbi:Na+/alanine symporter [Psychrobacter sp. PL15]|nr:Na+/alanine symporter [Psychrobacter sp. PL15]